MAHFAKIGRKNIVEKVIVISDNDAPTEQAGQQFIKKLFNELDSLWLQTSYNTSGNQHKLGGTPLRKNFAGVGDTYDSRLDAFYSPRPYNSWVLNEETCLWEAPIPCPNTFERNLTNSDGVSIPDKYYWHEQAQNWILI